MKSEKKGFKAKVKKFWAKYGPDLDRSTLILMGKGALPPTICLSIYQNTAVADVYTTLGYLMGIVSILGFAIMPRGKFLQTMILNVISTCFATSLNLLMFYCAVKAREHTEKTPSSAVGSPSPGAQTYTYNSSASAVSGIFLFFQVYFVNTIRAKYQPTLQFPCIIYTIFVVVASIYSPRFATMAAGISFAKRLLETFLTGFAVATGVSLFVYPMTSRKVVFMQMTGYMGALRGALKAHSAYYESLEMKDMFYRVSTGISGDKDRQPEAQNVKKAVAAIQALQGRLQGDLPFAKREIALGYLGPDDIQEMSRLLREIMLPMVGLSSVVDIFERLAEMNGWVQDPDDEEDEEELEFDRKRIVEDWNDIMQTVHEPFQSIIQAMDEGIEHVMLKLKFIKPPKKSKGKGVDDGDVEAKGDRSQPGEDGFAEYLFRMSEEFYQNKELALKEWCKRKGVDIPEDFFRSPSNYDFRDMRREVGENYYQRSQRSLYALLYMEYLLYSTSRAILEFVCFADERVSSGKLSKKRLILPGFKRIKKWCCNFLKEQSNDETDNMMGGDLSGPKAEDVYIGQAYKGVKDPEHLPPQSSIERFGNKVRAIPAFLRSSESAFGFRVACATMCIGIIDFLEHTQTFFVRQRLLWAMIMIAMSMSPTAGQSIFSFTLRIIGTTLAMCTSFIVWYIVDEHTPGVIVFFWLFACCGMYIILKKPRFVIVGMISTVTLTMIIGYELEVRKIGKAVASTNGQPFYPIYLLAPYRLAAVSGGLAVAFIWTFFPFPLSEHSQLRNKLGASLYLLARYYSVVHETFRVRIRGAEGDMALKKSPGRRMQKARFKIYTKQIMLLTNLRTISDFQKWEVPIGGKFPREKYNNLIGCVENIIRYMSLSAYASQTFADPADESETAWSNDFRRLISSVNLTSHEITSLLSLLSASITSGTPLPPYLKAPQPYLLSQRLEQMDKDILSLRHINEPGYAAFAVIQIATRCVIKDLEKLLINVKDLVGELDFSFHTISSLNTPGTSRAPSRVPSRVNLSRPTTGGETTGGETAASDDASESSNTSKED
ncbi:uncharacterized protein K452DRAFT_233796 [Aplosporella prunicola CBS 121167]|uniref:ER transporter 6TM N-terminal domain-containing protein n=1 Tax=Aplosporella prunicola CBS 121167 TaxID=1176127 RepID=A0A6A6B5Y7_9PEZI|nr:uncharacterized protein K452DRAFT_233796 [Aplosporella prunicola CBS 121167]KAF2138664.1 hypothetical protein K452DRAFT_233796 [Aplosporella prunicola CBS 121167]